MCTYVEWDPTGRYVMTRVSLWGHKVDNAYWLWNFQGKILMRSSVEKFCQLVWRPRPVFVEQRTVQGDQEELEVKGPVQHQG